MKKKKHTSPLLGDKILRLFASANKSEASIGDIEELYVNLAKTKGCTYARIWYWFQIVKSIGVYLYVSFYWRNIMLKNYIKIAFRNLKRQKGYSFLNISGLTIGLACCFFIFLFVQYETSYDQYHEDSDRIYRIIASANTATGTSVYAGTAHQLIPLVQKSYPQGEYIAKITPPPMDQQVSYGDKVFKVTPFDIPFADEDIFKILTFFFIDGNPNTALARPLTVVITKSTAEKYFGNENPIGKLLTFDDDQFEVTAVIEDPPGNTVFRFKMLRSWNSLSPDMFYPRWMNFHLTYVKLAPGEDPENFSRLLTQTINDVSAEDFKRQKIDYKSILQPIKRVHLHSNNFIFERSYVGNILYIYIFSGIGLIILLITVFNFINLMTARSSTRACEVGMRKVTGAKRRQLFSQFIGESIFLTAISFGLALFLAFLLIDKFNEFTQLNLHLSILGEPKFIVGTILAVIALGAAAGSYPALILSSFKPVSVLSRSVTIKGGALRKTLVVGQFALSITMIIAAFLFNNQLNFMKSESLGFSIEQKLIINTQNTEVSQNNYLSVKNEFASIPSVLGTTFSTGVPGRSYRHVRMWPSGQQDTNSHNFNFIEVDGDFLDLYDIEIVAGKNLSNEERANLSYMPSLLNETGTRTFGWDSPEDVLNEKFGDRDVVAVGVVKDFHYTGLQRPIEPFAISLRGGYDYLTLKIETENISETLSQIEEQFKTLFPNKLFEYSFLDEDFNRLYQREEQTAKIFGIFTFLGIFIAGLGLFGLAAFTVERRTKEIGIRKVLGASVTSIVIMLSKEFFKWVLISNLIAWPIAYFVLNQVLQDFAYRVNIGLFPFFISALLALIIAMITVSFQSIKAAVSNPVESLRFE
ncbi:ABC transporter permease [Acidobacteriota bacterium]